MIIHYKLGNALKPRTSFYSQWLVGYLERSVLSGAHLDFCFTYYQTLISIKPPPCHSRT